MSKPLGEEVASEPVLLVRVQSLRLALPLRDVTEICRPLPVQSVGGAPEFVRGVALIRGLATPVLHLGRLLGGNAAPGTRLVTARVRGRPVALEIDEVLGVRRLSRVVEAPSLLVGGALAERADSLGVLDGALLAWLSASRLVDDEILSLAGSEGA